MTTEIGLVTGLSENSLRNEIWKSKNGTVPVGGYPLEVYEDDLYAIAGHKKGYHED